MNRRATFETLPPVYATQRAVLLALSAAVVMLTAAMGLIFWAVTQ